MNTRANPNRSRGYPTEIAAFCAAGGAEACATVKREGAGYCAEISFRRDDQVFKRSGQTSHTALVRACHDYIKHVWGESAHYGLLFIENDGINNIYEDDIGFEPAMKEACAQFRLELPHPKILERMLAVEASKGEQE